MCGCQSNQQQNTGTAMTSDAHIFHVEDMSCGHCVGVIRKALEAKLPGAAIDIDLAKGEVRVGGDPVMAEEAIREAGYTPQARS